MSKHVLSRGDSAQLAKFFKAWAHRDYLTVDGVRFDHSAMQVHVQDAEGRITATRLLAFGVFGLFAKKRRADLVITNVQGVVKHVTLSGKDIAKAVQLSENHYNGKIIAR